MGVGVEEWNGTEMIRTAFGDVRGGEVGVEAAEERAGCAGGGAGAEVRGGKGAGDEACGEAGGEGEG